MPHNQTTQTNEGASARSAESPTAVLQFDLPNPEVLILHDGIWEGEWLCSICGFLSAQFTIAIPECAVRACVVCKNTLDLWEAFNNAAFPEGPTEMLCEEALRASEPWGVTYQLDHAKASIVNSVVERIEGDPASKTGQEILCDVWWFSNHGRIEIMEVRVHD